MPMRSGSIHLLVIRNGFFMGLDIPWFASGLRMRSSMTIGGNGHDLCHLPGGSGSSGGDVFGLLDR